MAELLIFLPLFVLLVVTGAFAGIIAGLLGVGGGIILVPAFFYIFGTLGYAPAQLMQICLATSLATIVVTSARSVTAHYKKGAVDLVILRSWAPGAAIGAAISVYAAVNLRSDILMMVFGVLGLIVALYLAFGRANWRLGSEMPTGLARMITSVSLGFLSVLMGIGGGSFGVPLMSLYGQPIHRAIGTASGFGIVIALPSVIGFLASGHEIADKPPLTIGYVNLPAFAIVVIMTLFTAPFGVALAHSMNPRPLRSAFAVFIGLMALNMLRKSWGT